jgi:hypothetical protein
MGGEFGGKVSHFTPEVMKILDANYGEGQWIVRPYTDEAYGGYGIFFPERVKQIQKDAQATIFSSGEEMKKYGFSYLREKKSKKIVGIKHKDGAKYRFDSDAYRNTIYGDVRQAADRAAHMASSEHGADIDQWSPKAEEGKAGGGTGENFPTARFMVSPAFQVVGISNEERAQGITFKKGQEGRVHIHTRNGKAEIVPHSTWLKKESMPVVFENDDTRAMAQAAVDAINALPQSQRTGQLYAPDIIKTTEGYKVVEANPANEAGASGYLADNPFIIDAYASHVTGREPAHVQFIRKLLSKRARALAIALGMYLSHDVDDEKRDEGGKWTEGGSSSSGVAKSKVKAVAGKVVNSVKQAHDWLHHAGVAGFHKLPRPVQIAVSKSVAVAFSGWTASQALAERISREKGATPEQAKKVRSILAAADLITFKPMAIATAGMGPVVAAASWVVPPVTACYLAHSAAVHPVATYRAAKGLVADAVRGAIERIGSPTQ